MSDTPQQMPEPERTAKGVFAPANCSAVRWWLRNGWLVNAWAFSMTMVANICDQNWVAAINALAAAYFSALLWLSRRAQPNEKLSDWRADNQR